MGYRKKKKRVKDCMNYMSVKGLNTFQKQVEFDRPGERSPEQDCCC